MDIAVYHDLPSHGGAFRVLASFIAGANAEHRVTVYTPRPDAPAQIALDLAPDQIVRMRRPGGGRPFSPRWMAMATTTGRAFARRIDAAGHDVLFCHSSEYAKAPELLPFVSTPSVYYAPEVHRILYDLATPGHAGPRGRAERAVKRRLRQLDRRSILAATSVVTHSHHTAASLLKVYGVFADVVTPGVDVDAFPPAIGGTTQPTILSVGSLTAVKGHDRVIEAIATMGADRPRLVVVGDTGDGAPALRALAARRDVRLDVHIGIPDAQLVALYQSASVVACGQREEPFGLVVLEAMATATPVVAVAEGGFLETVADGVTGLLVTSDPEAMGAAMTRVLAEPGLAASLASRASEQLRTRWRWDQTTASYLALLSAVSR